MTVINEKPLIVRNDTLQAQEVAQKIYENNGYCCCAVVKDADTICICKDFRDKVQDPEFSESVIVASILK